ncbi:MAG TPA: hypothetical protein GX522_05330 [Firmicutes bacterium]|nr:hypothetical protein [Bacillota bacterium]
MLRGLEEETVRLIADFLDNRKGDEASLANLSENERSELLDLLQWELGVMLDTDMYDELLYGEMELNHILNAFYEGIPIQ